MAQKPKARGAKKKAVPKKKAPDEKQFERFIETARKLGVDEGGNKFEKVFESVIRSKRGAKP
ncbi:hypothetical protein NB311A_02621 [Nitrobacter sp. Nb-311A]|uniref:hypothetical protein n=1 Tax=Nitrobacter sp. Nb-311A TaxID=314253 RepID=UPI000068753F|nr:hypothetical protein [Nitrobacter sp. Nb-311A]EAQ34694.1 hypothetical protein NB311A_02621 [Nitrobacter sp. Nb-311A]